MSCQPEALEAFCCPHYPFTDCYKVVQLCLKLELDYVKYCIRMIALSNTWDLLLAETNVRLLLKKINQHLMTKQN